MMFSRVAVVALALLLGTICVTHSALAGPILEVAVDHAIMFNRQFGSQTDIPYGSRAVLLRGEMVRYAAGASRTYSGYTVYVPCREHLSKSAVQQLAGSTRTASAAKGLVLELCDTDTANEQALALFFATAAADIPIYFLPRGEASQQLAKLLTSAATHSGSTDRVVLSIGSTVRTTAPTANLTLPTALIESTFTNRPKEARKLGASSLPHVLVTAHFDSLGVAPTALTNGGATGAVAAMELWRRLTAAPTVQEDGVAAGTSPYAVTMVLGSSSRFNYAGTKSWAAQHSDAELDRFKVVLSLDELLLSPDTAADAADLYLHVHDSLLKRPHGQQVVEQAEAVAKAHGISLKVVPGKTNYQHYDLKFEHEVFASRQMTAITLSARRTHHVDQIFRDVRRPPFTAADTAELTKRVNFVEALVRVLVSAGDKDASLQWPGSASYVMGMLHYASISHRSTVSHSGADLKQYATAVEHQMRAQASVAQRAGSSTATSTVTFLRLRMPSITLSGPYEEKMAVFLAKSYLFECGVAAVTLVAVLAFLYVELGVSGIKSLVLD
ncbi:putative mitochondrial hypothetical protein [Leptomonas pyrrhocoris]|uniref:Peptidase M28 domain-containing protein n=1 Tax=Leptomonas pyrrhocoris TaxID=157538 RepID=A0A0M9GBK6_LEPPY|nr:putative mitochondrial hypothetical protein [Leptomonas pyrrhocoris]KPA86849.1 putative mitochondrial hypothetical protein [Leptomonas pyrrhocoris]|eukprot:XP_015665288.1 putative mitochondrial hypothetical protein [Leptomonas pyrrhocoris]